MLWARWTCTQARRLPKEGVAYITGPNTGVHRAMPVSRLKFESLPHAIFLQRVTAHAPATSLDARLARVNRKQNRFDEAEAAYTEAGVLAAAAGDQYSELLSRIGRANTLLGRGNLAEAERCLQGILADARAAGQRDAEARAEHGIGVALVHMGQPADAIPHVWRAVELFEDEESRLRALNDIGIMLLSVGDSVGAERALSEVVRRGGTQESTSNALIELMHCASFRRDRVGFARWRERCAAQLADMPPNSRADYYLKQGIGQARFGQFKKADALMAQALEIASA